MANMQTNESWYFDDNTGSLQLVNDYNTGLTVTTSDRYALADADSFSNKIIPYPAYFYTTPLSVQNTHYGWFTRKGITTNVNMVRSISNVNPYPNPATSQLNVAFGADTTATVTLTNMVGQVVATQHGVTGKATFNVADLAPGMYIYTIETNGAQVATGHVVVAH